LDVPVFYLTQLLGLAFDISPTELGLNLNLSSIDKIDGLKLFPSNGTEEPDGPDSSISSTSQEQPSETSAETVQTEGGGETQ
jgi:hypothetical protein